MDMPDSPHLLRSGRSRVNAGGPSKDHYFSTKLIPGRTRSASAEKSLPKKEQQRRSASVGKKPQSSPARDSRELTSARRIVFPSAGQKSNDVSTKALVSLKIS